MARAVQAFRAGDVMETLVLASTFLGSIGAAWAIQRVILGLCLQAITVDRSADRYSR